MRARFSAGPEAGPARGSSRRSDRGRGRDTEQAEEGGRQLGAVQRVEVEPRQALGREAPALLDRDARGQHRVELGAVLHALEQGGEPGRDRGAAGGGEAADLGEAVDRHDAGHELGRDARDLERVAEAEDAVGIEAVLADEAGRPGVDLALQVLEVGERAAGLGMHLGVAGDADLEVGDGPEARHEVAREGVAVLAGAVGPGVLGRIASQGHDPAHPGLPVAPRQRVHVGARRAGASEVGRHGRAEARLDRADEVERALAGRAAGAAGYRDEARRGAGEQLEVAPEAPLRLGRAGREDLDRELDLWHGRPGPGRRDRLAIRNRHAASLRSALSLSSPAAAGRRALQITTVSSAPGSRTGGSGDSRSSASHVAISASANPSRRCARSCRSRSSPCAARSTTTSRPPGASTRAASASTRTGSSAKWSTWCSVTAANDASGSGSWYMSPWRTWQLRASRRSRLARATASMSWLMSTPSPKPTCGARSWSTRPVPVPTSSRLAGRSASNSRRSAASTRSPSGPSPRSLSQPLARSPK